MSDSPTSRRRNVLRTIGAVTVGAATEVSGRVVRTAPGNPGESTPNTPPPEKAWTKIYANPNHRFDNFNSIIESRDGDYVLAGKAAVNDAKRYDMLIVKIGPDGTKRWSLTQGGRHGEFANDIVQTSTGDFFVAGHKRPRGDGNWKALLTKISSEGTSLWTKEYGAGPSLTNSLTETADGGLAVVGAISRQADDSGQGWLFKTNVRGDTYWEQTFVSKRGDGFRSIAGTKDGGFVACGYHQHKEWISDAWIIKTDARGRLEWKTVLNEWNDNDLFSVIQTNDGSILAGGYTRDTEAFKMDGWLVKLDSKGNKLWSRRYDGPSLNDTIESVIQTRDGDYLLAGHVSQKPGSEKNNDKFWLVKVSPSGEKRWATKYGVHTRDYAKDVIQTSEGDYVLAGFLNEYGKSGITRSDGMVIKLDVNDPPNAALKVSEDPTAGRPVRFSAAPSADPDGSIGAYKWDFTGDGTVDARGTPVEYTYARPGTYRVVLTVVDQSGKRARTERTVQVAAPSTPSPTASPTTGTSHSPGTSTDTGAGESSSTASLSTLGIGAGAATLAGVLAWWRRRGED